MERKIKVTQLKYKLLASWQGDIWAFVVSWDMNFVSNTMPSLSSGGWKSTGTTSKLQCKAATNMWQQQDSKKNPQRCLTTGSHVCLIRQSSFIEVCGVVYIDKPEIRKHAVLNMIFFFTFLELFEAWNFLFLFTFWKLFNFFLALLLVWR